MTIFDKFRILLRYDEHWPARFYRNIRGLLSGPRNDRDFLLKKLPKQAICAEVGVFRGDFSKRILEICQPKRLHLIDPWLFFSRHEHKESIFGGVRGHSQKNLDLRYEHVKRRFSAEIASGQVVLHRKLSWEAALDFENAYFDWVYIDGDHSYEAVSKDLSSFADKVKPEGYLCGDDYFSHLKHRKVLIRAVDEFVATGFGQMSEVLNGQYMIRKEPSAPQTLAKSGTRPT